ncbi:MAG: FtsQ-type POTRA domain-containing protein [Oscillospiraceae bacterium]|nr:FtsQ-type POTRA domain-containing protein [Oscillospiraceae bacterium]
MARTKRSLPQGNSHRAFDQAEQAQRVRGGVYDQAQEPAVRSRSGSYEEYGGTVHTAGSRSFYDQSAPQPHRTANGPDILAHSSRRTGAQPQMEATQQKRQTSRRPAAGSRSNAHIEAERRAAPRPASRSVQRPRPEQEDDIPLPVTLRERGQAARLRARRRRAVLIGALILLLVGIWVLIAFVFKIGNMQVSGSSIYNETVILEKFGYRVGDNLFTFNKRKAEQEIAGALPYLETVKITRRLPDTVHIEVTGSVEQYCFVQPDGSTVITSPSLKVLRLGSNAAGLLEIRGVSFETPVPGQPLAVTEEENLQAVCDVLAALETGELKNFSALDMSDPFNISFKCEDRFIVRLGTTVNLEYKLRLVGEMIYNSLEPDATGLIDASSAWTSRSAYYRPQAVD